MCVPVDMSTSLKKDYILFHLKGNPVSIICQALPGTEPTIKTM